MISQIPHAALQPLSPFAESAWLISKAAAAQEGKRM
jgi:hypothetical protein